MMKRSLLAVAVTALTSQAVYAAPYMPMDARGLAMGNTGVASAKRAHAPAYNPSLLAQGSEKDDFALLFPQLGVQVADEEEMIDEAERISDDIFPEFEAAIDGGNLNGQSFSSFESKIVALNTAISALDAAIASANDLSDLQNLIDANNDVISALEGTKDNINLLSSSTSELTKSLNGISGNPLSAKLGVGSALAIPSKKFAAAISIQGSANISARAKFSADDLSLLNSYPGAANDYVNLALGTTTDLSNDLTAVQNASNPTEQANLLIDAKNSTDAAIDSLNNFNSGYQKEDGSTVNIFTGGEFVGDSPDMSSTVQIVAVAMVDIGLSFAREFDIKGEKVAFGITPKLQKISTFHYADEIDGFDDVDEDTLKDTQQDYTRFNMDIGASYRFGGSEKWMVGVVGKNLLGGSFDYADVLVTPKDSEGLANGVPYMLEGGKVKLNPQFRAGVAYNGDWTSIALDVDLVENDPVAFENATQYASLGVELDVFSFL